MVLRSKNSCRFWPNGQQLSLLILLVAGVVLAGWQGNFLTLNELKKLSLSPTQNVVVFLTISLTAMTTLAMPWRFWLWRQYCPWRLPKQAKWPTATVVIPVYNEGKNIIRSLDSVMTCDYPKKQLQVIVVDDGSEDDTDRWIQAARIKYPDRLLTLRCPKNLGKRHALSLGFKQATGWVWVTMDSDCILETDSLKQLVSPLLAESRIGAVAGHVQVLNQNSGIIAKMLSVSFSMAFDFGRATQSVLRSVLCTPGAFSAYRSEALSGLMDDWQFQTFLGRSCRIAEDRALTNLLLARGWDTVYQSTARVHTRVPSNLSGLWKMFLRWTRGDIRESAIYMTHLTFHWEKKYRYGLILNFLISVIEMIVPVLVLICGFGVAMQYPGGLLTFLAGTVLGCSLMILWYIYHYRSWDFVYGFVYNLFWWSLCSWIVPWSFLTFWDDRWLTRRTDKSSKTPIMEATSPRVEIR